jgi:hypothetical protein
LLIGWEGFEREGVVHSHPEAIAAFIKSNAPHVAPLASSKAKAVKSDIVVVAACGASYC